MTTSPGSRTRPDRRAVGGRLARHPSTFLVSATLAVLILAGLAGGLALDVHGTDVESRVEETRLLARAAAEDIDRYLQSQIATLAGMAASAEVQGSDPAVMRAYFDRSDPASLGFDGQIFWLDRGGTLRARSDYVGPPLDFSDRDWYRAVAATGRPVVSQVRIGQLNRAPIVVLAVPTTDAMGRWSGVLGGAFRLDRLRTGAYDLRRAAGIEIDIVDAAGHLVAGDAAIGTLVDVAAGFPWRSLLGNEPGVLRDVVGPTGAAGRLVGYATVPSGGWIVAVDSRYATVVGPARERLVQQLGLVALLAALALLVLRWATRRIGTALDESERAYLAELEAHQRLGALVGELETRAAAGEAFAGVLSHELRTPITTIFGMASLLRRSPDREDREAIAEDIEEEAERLRRIIEDLLVLSRAETGAIHLATEPVLVQRLVPSIRLELARRFRDVAIVPELPRDLPPVAAEEGPLRQVLANLLSNAAKYGGGWPVTFSGRLVAGGVELAVADRGPGIPAEDRDRIFELFYRSPRTSRKSAGTGIGLYVVRRLVEAMGGSVVASDRPGGGSVFTIRLRVYEVPLETAAPARARSEGRTSLAPEG